MGVDDEVTDETTWRWGIEGVAVECMVFFLFFFPKGSGASA